MIFIGRTESIDYTVIRLVEYLTQPNIDKFLTQPTSQSKDCRSGGQAVRRMIISIKAKQTSIIMSRSKKKKARAIIQRHSC